MDELEMDIVDLGDAKELTQGLAGAPQEEIAHAVPFHWE